MKQSINLKHTQKLTMTPQLQQAVRLLQMSAVELNQEIQHAQETNPMLEILDAPTDGQEYAGDGIQDEVAGQDFDDFDPGAPDSTADSKVEDMAEIVGLEFSRVREPESVWDEAQSYTPIDQRRSPSDSNRSFEFRGSEFNIPEDPMSLREMLGNQAIYLFHRETDRRIAHHIIQNINDAGYLEVPLAEIKQSLLTSSQGVTKGLEMIDIERVLTALQKLEPSGVAARDPGECLMLQLQNLDSKLPGYSIARDIIADQLPLLAKKDYTQLRKVLGVSRQQLVDAVALIQQLNPHPGYSVGNAKIDYVVPDVVVEHCQDHWIAKINPASLPKISINQDYQKLVSQSDRGDYSSMKEQLAHARWLLNNLEKRHQTILSVAREIVERQQGFFEHGPGSLIPMTLNDIATPLGIHESTVSRATSGKFLSAPRGTFELKYFFSSQLESRDGDQVSSRAIQSRIRQIIENESTIKPVSDEKIGTLLAKQGYKVARRTVAKYREQMSIPSSSKRKTLQ